ncbi:MAG: hypothetical protein KGJ07_09895 [Patescibacteria group bacterium]|nr:hypothetical protein [Patescibacteria group bacterium]
MSIEKQIRDREKRSVQLDNFRFKIAVFSTVAGFSDKQAAVYDDWQKVVSTLGPEERQLEQRLLERNLAEAKKPRRHSDKLQLTTRTMLRNRIAERARR